MGRDQSQPPDPGMAVKMAPPGMADLDRLLAGEPIDEAAVLEICDFVDARHDCADFRALTLLRIAHSDNPHLSAPLRDGSAPPCWASGTGWMSRERTRCASGPRTIR